MLSLKITVFRIMTSSSIAQGEYKRLGGTYCPNLHFYPEYFGRNFLWNSSNHLKGYNLAEPRRSKSEVSQPWTPQISLSGRWGAGTVSFTAFSVSSLYIILISHLDTYVSCGADLMYLRCNARDLPPLEENQHSAPSVMWNLTRISMWTSRPKNRAVLCT
jgi:hypothetical protein